MAEIYVGDIGTVLEIQVMANGTPQNLSDEAIDDLWLIIQSPDSQTITKKKSAEELIITDKVQGKFTFKAPKGFWSKAGRWKAQVKVIIESDVDVFYGTPISWDVIEKPI